MYNSYDVHFYASHALSKNFPELQKSLQYDLRDYVFLEVPDKVKMVDNGKTVERKQPNTVPHDAGDPGTTRNLCFLSEKACLLQGDSQLASFCWRCCPRVF